MDVTTTTQLGRPKDNLILQTKDGSQCVTWTNSQLTYMGRDTKELPLVLGRVYGRYAQRLDLSFCSLTSLKGLEAFTLVVEIILDNNCLSDDVSFPFMPHVKALSLNKNRFQRLQILLDKLSRSFPNLTFLSLLGNEVCPNQISNDDSEYTAYRKRIVAIFPHLKFLDSNRVTKDDRNHTEKPQTRVINFVIRPSEEQITRLDDSDDGIAEVATAMGGDETSSQTPHSTAYGRVKYRYTGKHSEGNRFIRNNQL